MIKYIILIFIFFINPGLSSAENYYYYKGNKIDLQQRNDRVAVILNTNFLSKQSKLGTVSDAFSSAENVVEVCDNVYLLKYNNDLNNSELSAILSYNSGSNGLIKLTAPVYRGQSDDVMQIAADEFIVRLKNPGQFDALNFLNVEHNVRIIGNVKDENGFLLKTNDGVTKNALELSMIYSEKGLFEYTEPNFIYPEFCLLNFIPNDPLFSKQWSLNNTGQLVPTGSNVFGDQANTNSLPGSDVDANLAWDVTRGSQSVKIGIFDTGLDSTHTEFNHTRKMAGYDAFYNKYGVPKDSGAFGGHGTCCAGISSARGNNGVGVTGISPNCVLMAFRIFNMVGSSTSIGIARAFDTARVIGIDVLSNSWNGMTPVSVLTDAIQNAAYYGRGGLGCPIFFAAGNNGRFSVWYPSYLPFVVSVGGSTTHDQKKSPGNGNQYYWGSNYGEDINGDLDVVAPTVCYTTDIQGVFGYNGNSGPDGAYYDSFRGTSCATPLAAGISALMLSVNPAQTKDEVISKLYKGCNKIDNVSYSTTKPHGKWNDYYGYGRVNAYNSVKLAAGIDVTPPTIVHKNVLSHSSTYPTIIDAEIIDQDGFPVPQSGVNSPEVFYRLNKNNSGWSEFDSLKAFSISGNVFSFKIPCLGYETQVQYYIRAKDNIGNQAYFPNSAPNSFKLCYFAVGSMETINGKIDGFTCADPGTTFSNSTAFGNFNIVNTRVQIFLNHQRLNDEIIILYSPLTDENNNRICLFSSNGGDASNIHGATVSDSSDFFWGNGSPPYEMGVYKGDYLLNGLNGKNAGGLWKILNYDQFSGSQGVFDSVIISFTKTRGIPSSSISIESPEDSLINFGTVIYPDSVIRDFYLKNSGNAVLITDSISISGMFAENFEILSVLPGSISPGDSALITVKLRAATLNDISSDSLSGIFEAGVLNIYNNDPSKTVFRVSLLAEFDVVRVFTLNLKMLIQGFYTPAEDTIAGDTVSVILRHSNSPFEIIDSCRNLMNSSGLIVFKFLDLPNEGHYALQVRHRNSLETWSVITGLSFENGIMNYDFTDSASKAYGDNQVQLNESQIRYGFISGDVNQDGSVDGTDQLLVSNDAASLLTGYVPSDINGDGFVDGTDALITANNAEEFFISIKP